MILQAFKGGTLSFDGSYYKFKDVPLHLTPFQRPHPPIWYGLSNPESAARGRRRTGMNIVANVPAATARTLGRALLGGSYAQRRRPAPKARHHPPSSSIADTDEAGARHRAARVSPLVGELHEALARSRAPSPSA